MVKVRDFEFSLREFAGALGDFGPLNPFIIGYISILGLNPTGIFLAMGLTNIVLGFIYRLPLPVEAKKAIGTAALNERWKPSQVYLSGILSGIVWLAMSFSGFVKKLAKLTPIVVIRGIQLGLALILLKESIILMKSNFPLALISIFLIILLIKNSFLPSAIAVFILGLALVFFFNPSIKITIGFYLPSLFIPSIKDVNLNLLTTVFAQILLTFSNAILATCLAVNDRFPNRRIEEKSLAMNMGLMNVFLSFIGGIPMCHGAEGFASQYFFGGRTGGAMIMEGICEIVLALFFAESIAAIFNVFPASIIGAMLLFASLELGKFVTAMRRIELAQVIIIGIISFFTNLAAGFLIGIIIVYLLKRRILNSVSTRNYVNPPLIA
jgi:MFS superfamily sulfate permease-like transporter